MRAPTDVSGETVGDAPDEPIAHPAKESLGRDAQLDELMRDVRLFRAHLQDLLHRAVETLLEQIANDVLMRELSMAPADIERVVQETLTGFAVGTPKLRVHPGDAQALEKMCIPVQSDVALEPGDVVVEFTDGAFSSTIRSRLTDAVVRSLLSVA
ncbi:MAG: hypothetical protein JO165_10725 [Candidatus Eremiobacteraeota bacterium]|nr:hypothetical protein [Candidatus Eremiobacteraeota bacterium]